MTQIVLASGSTYRADLLRNAGVSFEITKANIDERAVELPLLKAGLGPGDVAEILAIAKAEDVSAGRPDDLVIGCDQTLSLDGELLHKPADMEEARRRLLALSGKTHELHSAIVLVRNGETIWTHIETCEITFRKLDPGFVGRHMAEVGEAALTSVGAYQIEGPGVQLISAIKGDYFSIMGLPLLPLLAQLRKLEAMGG